MQRRQLLLEQPALDRCQRHLALHQPLLGVDRGHAARDCREARDGWLLEHLSRGEVQAKPVGACHQLDRLDRIAAERKEVVVDADAVELEHVAPDRRERLLGRRARLDAVASPVPVRRRQGVAVELAIGRERQPLQHYERRRHHVVRQRGLQVAAQLVGRHLAAGRDIADQPAVAAVVAHHHRSLLHVGVGQQRRLDLAEFDAEAADLDLMVEPAEVVERAVGAPARQIAGAVEPRSRHERIGHEALRGQAGPAEIAARHPDAADMEFAGNTERHRIEAVVEHMELDVADRTADRHLACGRFASALPGADVDRGLGRSIEIV